MYRKLFYLAAIILVLGLAGNVSAGLLAHYQFEGNFANSGSGTAVGTPTGGAKIVTDPNKGQVLSLDGTDDYVYVGNDDAGQITNNITIAAWIKTPALGGYDSIVTKGYNWRLLGGKDNTVVMQCMDTEPAGSQAAGKTNVGDDKWHHVAGTYDGKEYRVYVDGVLDVNSPSPGTGLIQNFGSNVICIGAHYKTSDPDARRFFKGLIDDVRIYDEILTPEAIQGLAVISKPAEKPLEEPKKEEPKQEEPNKVEPAKQQEEKPQE